MQIHANHYQKQSIETASPAQLVLMLYDRALRSLAQVQQASLPRDTEMVNRELQRVQAIVNELQTALDHDRGQPIASQLASLYDYSMDRLITANVRKDLTMLDEVAAVISGLRDAWQQACVDGATLVGS